MCIHIRYKNSEHLRAPRRIDGGANGESNEGRVVDHWRSRFRGFAAHQRLVLELGELGGPVQR